MTLCRHRGGGWGRRGGLGEGGGLVGAEEGFAGGERSGGRKLKPPEWTASGSPLEENHTEWKESNRKA